MKFSIAKPLWGLALASAMIGGPAAAQTPEEFYQGKTVTMVVAAAAGGFADTIARAFVTEFQTHFPGKPDIVVVNKPGAGGLVAASQLVKVEKKDGTTIGFLLGNVLTTPLVTGKEAQFNPHDVQWIGSLENGDYPYTLYSTPESGVATAEDLQTKPLVLGATSYTNYNRVFPALMNDMMGTKIDIISGYKGSGEVYLALERGEVQGWMEGSHPMSGQTNKASQLLADDVIQPVILMKRKADEDYPDLPVIGDYISDPLKLRVAGFLIDSSATGRPIAVPAEVPADRVEAIRAAFEATLDDPEAVERMKSVLRTPVVKITAAQVETLVDDFYGASEEVLDLVRGYMVE